MSTSDVRSQEKREIAADRRAEWWLVLKTVVALAVVAALVVLGHYGVGR